MEVGLRVDDDAGTVGQAGRAEVEYVAIRRDRKAQIGRRIAKCDEYHRGTGPARDLGDLAVYPDPPEPRDPAADLLAHHAHRPRLLGRGPAPGRAGAGRLRRGP